MSSIIYTVKDKWCYLATVIDLYTKKVIDYAFSKTMDTELAIRAVENAHNAQKQQGELILHSDLGSQYISVKFQEHILSKNTHLVTEDALMIMHV
ncbi:MAG TPA: DDE-type integrase/transposase/recombinase [Clostridiaceae bacterium]|nr:DDE-type integrase/transposase/recombinase [Clostridiaceae bacterium]